jgi:hypothetical protein
LLFQEYKKNPAMFTSKQRRLTDGKILSATGKRRKTTISD